MECLFDEKYFFIWIRCTQAYKKEIIMAIPEPPFASDSLLVEGHYCALQSVTFLCLKWNYLSSSQLKDSNSNRIYLEACLVPTPIKIALHRPRKGILLADRSVVGQVLLHFLPFAPEHLQKAVLEMCSGDKLTHGEGAGW